MLSRRLKPASLGLTMRPLSQAPLLGRLCRPHGYLSGAALSPPTIIRRQLRPKDSLLPGKEAEVLALRGPFPHSSAMLRDAPVEAGCPVPLPQGRGLVRAEQKTGVLGDAARHADMRTRRGRPGKRKGRGAGPARRPTGREPTTVAVSL
jgi:hypothetical protein